MPGVTSWTPPTYTRTGSPRRSQARRSETYATTSSWPRRSASLWERPRTTLASREEGLSRRKGLVRLKGEDPIYAARAIFPHLAGREIRLDARKTLGIRCFSSNLPTDFALRAVMGHLPESTAR